MMKNAVFFVLLSKNTHKTHKIVKVTFINDNNNFAPSLFRSLCEFVGDCFGPRYFSSGAALPQKNTSVQNNHLRFHTMTSKKMVCSYYCLIRDDFKTQPPVDRWFCPLPGRLSLFRTIESDRNWTKPPVNQRFIFEVIPYIKDKLFSFPGRYELGYNLHIFYRIVSKLFAMNLLSAGGD